MSGRDFPEVILEAILSKSKLVSNDLGIVNLTPYDGWLETVVLDWPSKKTRVRSMSICDSKLSGIVEYCQKTISMRLLEDLFKPTSGPLINESSIGGVNTQPGAMQSS